MILIKSHILSFDLLQNQLLVLSFNAETSNATVAPAYIALTFYKIFTANVDVSMTMTYNYNYSASP